MVIRQERPAVEEEIDLAAWKELACAVIKSAVEDYVAGYSYVNRCFVDPEIWFKRFCNPRVWVWGVVDLNPEDIYQLARAKKQAMKGGADES